ncbi:hypothetical protein RBH26_05310 [Natronolimnohabitans sp. A-GB9]|uniref:DUF7331 family protein n=1 Tax=Natronolimnohabitans sp. A-GB9 TaxID=3069757 RepID=UPI0027B03ADE|nr:hypothetical protein [Natronolimnohabitans sp. A-GB9]MDQ2049896.1 hypothetical protein [Natronolimnohabitans sp. A-GB9]
MRSHTDPETETDQSVATEHEFDQYVRYEADEGTVICDRRNPSAWIRSTVLRPCRR